MELGPECSGPRGPFPLCTGAVLCFGREGRPSLQTQLTTLSIPALSAGVGALAAGRGGGLQGWATSQALCSGKPTAPRHAEGSGMTHLLTCGL